MFRNFIVSLNIRSITWYAVKLIDTNLGSPESISIWKLSNQNIKPILEVNTIKCSNKET
jgi:hypothetical protein